MMSDAQFGVYRGAIVDLNITNDDACAKSEFLKSLVGPNSKYDVVFESPFSTECRTDRIVESLCQTYCEEEGLHGYELKAGENFGRDRNVTSSKRGLIYIPYRETIPNLIGKMNGGSNG